MDANEVASQKWERIERIGTILAFLATAAGMFAMGAPESIVGGAVASAATLAMPGGGSRYRVAVGAGVGAAIGAVIGGWDPTTLA